MAIDTSEVDLCDEPIRPCDFPVNIVISFVKIRTASVCKSAYNLSSIYMFP